MIGQHPPRGLGDACGARPSWASTWSVNILRADSVMLAVRQSFLRHQHDRSTSSARPRW